MATFTERVIGAAKLNVHTYEEVEADKTALRQAMGVVVLSSLAAGVGAGAGAGITGLLVGAMASLVGWFIWALLTYFIGTRLLAQPQTRADLGQLLRTIGFSSSPGLLRILGVVPGLGVVIVFVAQVWMLTAMVVAVRQALDYTSTWRALGVCIIGWIVLVAITALLMGVLGGTATAAVGA
ncbi:MAG: YIP1 family protein [Acidobacteriota bacterium]